MFSSILSATVLGMDAYLVRVEVDICDGLPQFSMVGDLAPEVREAADRVRTALRNTGISFPPKKVTINLSPAHIRKEGTRFDLPIAAGLLVALGVVPRDYAENIMMVGEIGLNGAVRPVSGVLQTVMLARQMKSKFCIIPRDNRGEGASLPGILVVGIESLKELLECLLSPSYIEAHTEALHLWEPECASYSVDFCEVNGQHGARRAAEIAAAGMHNFLMIGSPGSGKTMIAQRMPTILPALTMEESLEISKVYSACGLLVGKEGLAKVRPFRAPHHTISANALAGGGKKILPGEISLATRGVLFLDELPEFSRNVLEVLRQPMEEGWVTISRVNGKYSFPAHFQMIAAMNPCRCGFYPDRQRCSCLPGEVRRYIHKISWPLLDRMDLCTEVSRVEYTDLLKKTENESSARIRERVEAAHRIQKERYVGCDWQFNARLPSAAIKRFCPLNPKEEQLMETAFEKMQLSARAYHRIIRVARTIADLDKEEQIRESHLLEAIGYRQVDQKYWEE